MDHLLDNVDDVVGLELGPRDEPLLPGTLIPMRGVRPAEEAPPAASASGSATGGGKDGGGGGGGKGGSGSSTGKEATERKEAGGGGGITGDVASGAKMDSMRRWG